MIRFVSPLLLSFCLIALAGGCRLCCNDSDTDYAAFGGAWQRTERTSGRVASLFDPGGARAASLSPRNQPINDGPAATEPTEDSSEDLEDQPLDLDSGLDEDVDEDLQPAPDADDLRSLELDDLEDDETDRLKDLDLEDIEVKVVPRSGGSIY